MSWKIMFKYAQASSPALDFYKDFRHCHTKEGWGMKQEI